MVKADFLNLRKIFIDWNITKEDTEHKLLSKNAFNKVELRNFTLSWPNVVIEIENEAGEIMKLPYEIGPDVLYDLSQEIDSDETKFGSLIKSARLKSGLTQEQLVL
ncbi:hypothetical protein ERX46_16845 [Brumimicrobium glaciale]|uniref:Uncharacterized protein n=1 Tax=Brumimicrobium glaciale TaxID=200475 RepID=A0A4Q4KFA6_9FLAO|nr:hypothetical protein [Brumimicrobium glaciale]RYM31350.1 hypothetical protein ERX46_16845 [Brumimicrobium glaciale]